MYLPNDSTAHSQSLLFGATCLFDFVLFDLFLVWLVLFLSDFFGSNGVRSHLPVCDFDVRADELKSIFCPHFALFDCDKRMRKRRGRCQSIGSRSLSEKCVKERKKERTQKKSKLAREGIVGPAMHV